MPKRQRPTGAWHLEMVTVIEGVTLTQFLFGKLISDPLPQLPYRNRSTGVSVMVKGLAGKATNLCYLACQQNPPPEYLERIRTFPNALYYDIRDSSQRLSDRSP